MSTMCAGFDQFGPSPALCRRYDCTHHIGDQVRVEGIRVSVSVEEVSESPDKCVLQGLFRVVDHRKFCHMSVIWSAPDITLPGLTEIERTNGLLVSWCEVEQHCLEV